MLHFFKLFSNFYIMIFIKIISLYAGGKHLKNKSFIYLAILFISLLAISTVSASEFNDDILLDEDSKYTDNDLLSSTEVQSVDDSFDDILSESIVETDNKDIEISNIKSSPEDSNILTDYDPDEYDIDFYNTTTNRDNVVEVNAYSWKSDDQIKIYVDNESKARKTYNVVDDSYIMDTGYSLNLDYGTHFLKVTLIRDYYEYTLATSEIKMGYLRMVLDEESSIFENLDAEVVFWDLENDEGTLTFSINNKVIGSTNCTTYTSFTIPSSYLKIGKNVVSAKYVGPNFPTSEISEVINICPKVNDLPIFISTGESANLVVNFPKSFTGKINVYEAYMGTYGDIIKSRIMGSANIQNGVATFKLSNLEEDTYRFIIESVTNQGTGEVATKLAVIENSPSVKVEISPLNLIVGENAFLTFNAPVSNTLYVSIDGKTEKMYGMSSYIKVLSGLSIGKHTVSIKFDDRDSGTYYNPFGYSYSNTFSITVNAVKTSISSSNVNAVYDTTKSISATLKDNLGNPIVGKTLSLVINKKTYTAKTNANGKATFKVSAKLLPKAYTATIKFAGDKTYAQFTKSIKVTVKKATPKMTAKAKTFRVKVKTKKYTITLKNNNGKVMKNTKVTLKVNKKTFTAKTNSKGIATFKITNLKKKGSFTAVVTYAATKYYNKVVKKPKITVKK